MALEIPIPADTTVKELQRMVIGIKRSSPKPVGVRIEVRDFGFVIVVEELK